MAVRTKRWTRSPRGAVLGVATGLAEWRGFPVDTTRLIVFLVILFTGLFPGLLIYLALAIILPEQKEEDISDYYSCSGNQREHSRSWWNGCGNKWGNEGGNGSGGDCCSGRGKKHRDWRSDERCNDKGRYDEDRRSDEIYTTFDYSEDKESDWDRRFMDK